MAFLFSIFALWSLAVISPGPNLFLILRYSMATERKAAFAAALGIASGTLIWSIAGAFGIVTLFNAQPTLFLIMRLAGAAYLTFMGFKMLKAALRNSYHSHVSTQARETSFARAYRAGVMTNLSNPKTAIFVSALFAAVSPEGLSLGLGIAGALEMVLISICWYTLVAFLLTSETISRRVLSLRRFIDGVAGLAFLGFAGKLVLSRQ